MEHFLPTGLWRKKVINIFIVNNQDNSRYLVRVVKFFIPVCTLYYMLGIFGLLETFFANLSEWNFVIGDILSPMLISFCVKVFLVSLIIPIWVKGKNLKYLCVILCDFCVGMYIQNAFLNSNLFIDGSVPQWRIYEHLIDMFIWGVVMIVPLLIVKKKIVFATYINVLCGALLFMQLAPLPYLFLSAPEESFIPKSLRDEYDLIGDEQFVVSDQENVIVFIMDRYDRNSFSDWMQDHPEIKEEFSDFVFFDNVNSQVLHTAFSLPYILTGQDTDYSIDLQESNKQAWNGDSANKFYSSMHDNGYEVFLYTDCSEYAGGAENMLGKIDNVDVCRKDYVTDGYSTYLRLIDLAKYKYYPYIFKYEHWIGGSADINQYTQIMYNGQAVDLSQFFTMTTSSYGKGISVFNFDYYNGLKQGLKVDNSSKRCIFQHLHGMHEPYVGIDDGSVIVDKDTAQEGCLTIVKEYIEQLKAMGLYETSTIILTADHGIAETALDESRPVMLIKPKNYSGKEMVINSVPGDLQKDLLPTVLDCAGLPYNESGLSLFAITDQNRVRNLRVFAYNSEFEPAKKCTAVGSAVYNCYYEFIFQGREVDLETANPTVHPITSYWW